MITAEDAKEYCPYPELAEFQFSVPLPEIRKGIGCSCPTFREHKRVLGVMSEPLTPDQVVVLACLVSWCQYGAMTGQTAKFSRATFVSTFETSKQWKKLKGENWNKVRNQIEQFPVPAIHPAYYVRQILRACDQHPADMTITVEAAPVIPICI